MTTYFTADLHLHHKNIIRYCHRNPPFKDIPEMDSGLIKNWNKVVKKFDTVYHLGDFYKTHDSRVYSNTMHLVNGRIIFIRGNHDEGLEHASYFICRRINGIQIFMRHWPPWVHPRRFPHSFNIPFDVDIILCGHVHDKWKLHVHKMNGRSIPVVNVGVDVWEYKPVSLNDMMVEV